MAKKIKVGKVAIGKNCPIAVIAGPCVIENRDVVFETAEGLAGISSDLGIPVIFKASYDKANRTSADSYRGPGRDEGLAVLAEARKKFDLPVTTDIHSIEDAEHCPGSIDLIQVPAFLCRQTDILVAAGKTGLPVNVKKGQFLAPNQVKGIVDKITSTGNSDVMITERGSCFGYGGLVNDFGAVTDLRKLGCPLVFDVTHSAQTPGSEDTFTGGRIEAVPILARCAAAAGFDVLFFEVHPNPSKAMSDAQNTVPLDEFADLLKEVLPFAALARKQG